MIFRKIAIGLLFVTALPFVLIGTASAQAGTPSPDPSDSWIGHVSGTITNQTPGSAVSGELDIMLHAWDQQYNQKQMVHGKSATDGTFVFDEIPFEPGLIYAVMADYDGVMYFSDPASVEADQPSLQIEVPIYETTDDLSQARIEQMHVLFSPEPEGLAVSEVYVLSNLGKTSIQGAQKLDDGTPVTLKFPLPEDATRINFNEDNGGRFLQFPGGFADTSSLLPGESRNRVMVSYLLPYENGLTFSYTAPLPISSSSFLTPNGSGISLEGDGLVAEGEWSTQDGTNFSVFSHDSIQSGQTIQLTLSGDLQSSVVQNVPLTTSVAGKGIAIGSIVLGLALVSLGVWWWRRPTSQPEIVSTRELDEILTDIALLDQAHERGDVEEDEYVNQRTVLRLEAKAAVQLEHDKQIG